MIIRVPDLGGDYRHDLYFHVDKAKFTDITAAEAVTQAVIDVQTADPEHYTFDDLIARLPDGIAPAHVITIDNCW